jgi:hypothetical protein
MSKRKKPIFRSGTFAPPPGPAEGPETIYFAEPALSYIAAQAAKVSEAEVDLKAQQVALQALLNMHAAQLNVSATSWAMLPGGAGLRRVTFDGNDPGAAEAVPPPSKPFPGPTPAPAADPAATPAAPESA